MIRRLKSDLRTLEWTDALELLSLLLGISALALFAGIKTGAI